MAGFSTLYMNAIIYCLMLFPTNNKECLDQNLSVLFLIVHSPFTSSACSQSEQVI